MGDFYSFTLEVLGRIHRSVVLVSGPYAFLLHDDGDLRLLVVEFDELTSVGPINGEHGLIRSLTTAVWLRKDPFVGARRKLPRPITGGTGRLDCRCEHGVEDHLQGLGFDDVPCDELLQLLSG